MAPNICRYVCSLVVVVHPLNPFDIEDVLIAGLKRQVSLFIILLKPYQRSDLFRKSENRQNLVLKSANSNNLPWSSIQQTTAKLLLSR